MLRFPDVRERTGLSRTTVWRLERRGQFPAHRQLSANTVGWLEEEVTAWIRSRLGTNQCESQVGVDNGAGTQPKARVTRRFG